MIYIDPPYNRESDGFVYSDQFQLTAEELSSRFDCDETEAEFIVNTFAAQTHSGWLAFMYSRLKVARDLLCDDGVMFISIDDVELPNLYVICKELFGDKNIDCFVWRKSGSGRDGKMKNTNTFRKDHEYLLVMFKHVNYLNKAMEYPKWDKEYPNRDNDPRGPYEAGSMSRVEHDSQATHVNFYEVTSPSGKTFRRQFDVSESEFAKLDKDKRIWWGIKGDAVPRIKIFLSEKRSVNSSSILEVGTTTEGSKELDKLLGMDGLGNEFRPKPTALIKRLIQLGTRDGGDDIVMDFFAGTGTTGEAVMQLNAEDGGSRRFVLVQLDEKILKSKSPRSVAYCETKRKSKDISSITLGRLRASGGAIKKSKEPYACNTDVGFRVFKLVLRPFVQRESSTGGLFVQIRSERSSYLDVLFNLICSAGYTLDESFHSILQGKVYNVGGDTFVVSSTSVETLIKYTDSRIFVDGWGDLDLQLFVNEGLSSRTVVVY